MSAGKLVRLDYAPRKWQLAAHAAKKAHRFIVLALHRRAGKTVFALMELVDKAARETRDLALYAYIAPQLKQAKTNIWEHLKAKVEPLRRTGVCDVLEGELTILFKHNGARIRLFGADNPDALRGVRLDGVVVDEVAQVKPEVWEDILQPALSDRLGWAIFIGTPKGVNLFSQLFYKAQSTPGWFAARFTIYDTNSDDIAPESRTHTAEELKRLADPANMNETSFAREYLCDFTASGDDQLIALADVEEAARRTYQPKDIADAALVFGVDPARFGDDRSVIVPRRGLVMFQPIVMRGVDNMQLAARVALEIDERHPDAVFVDSGAGAGVIDRLRQLGHRISEVAFGGKASKPNLFLNRRAEMWWAVKEWIEAGGSIWNDAGFKQELATPKYWFDAAERRVIEPKDDIKERLQGGASPDIADALALTFAMPVQARSKLDVLRERYRPGGERLSPLDRFDRMRQEQQR